MGIVLPEGIYNNPSLAHVREFTEDRAFLKAVVSLPQETFISSGASVKCSLLFLQKYTEEQKQKFDETYAHAKTEIDDKYADEIDSRNNTAGNRHCQSQGGKGYRWAQRVAKRVESLSQGRWTKKRPPNPASCSKSVSTIPFLCTRPKRSVLQPRVRKMGMSFIPNPTIQRDDEKTCLEWYREFLADPEAFAEAGGAE